MILGSRELIRDINSRLVLSTIMKEGSISRASISKKLGLTKATVSSIVQELINSGLVIETGSDDTNLGRKPILVTFNREFGSAISVEIGPAATSVLLADLGGDIKALKKIKTPSAVSLIDTLSDLISDILASFKDTSFTNLIGITVGIHGITADNNIIFTPYNDLSDCRLSEELSKTFNVPIHIENEANLSVIGERAFISEEYKNIAGISIHSGVGAGIILNGMLYTGSYGFAGEFGHTIINIDGRSCPCGNRGCLEQYLSETALLNEFAVLSGRETADFMLFENACRLNVPEAHTVIEHFISYMSVCINNITNSLNPDIIIINSSFTRAFPELTDCIAASVNSVNRHPVTIIPSKLNENAALLGGICVAVSDYLGITDKNFSYLTGHTLI